MERNIPLYYYQQEAVDAIKAAYYRDLLRSVVCMPTGSGKTRVGIAATNELLHPTQRALFLTPFIDLIEQTSKAFREWYPAQHIGVVQAQGESTGTLDHHRLKGYIRREE